MSKIRPLAAPLAPTEACVLVTNVEGLVVVNHFHVVASIAASVREWQVAYDLA